MYIFNLENVSVFNLGNEKLECLIYIYFTELTHWSYFVALQSLFPSQGSNASGNIDFSDTRRKLYGNISSYLSEDYIGARN